MAADEDVFIAAQLTKSKQTKKENTLFNHLEEKSKFKRRNKVTTSIKALGLAVAVALPSYAAAYDCEASSALHIGGTTDLVTVKTYEDHLGYVNSYVSGAGYEHMYLRARNSVVEVHDVDGEMIGEEARRNLANSGNWKSVRDYFNAPATGPGGHESFQQLNGVELHPTNFMTQTYRVYRIEIASTFRGIAATGVRDGYLIEYMNPQGQWQFATITADAMIAMLADFAAYETAIQNMANEVGLKASLYGAGLAVFFNLEGGSAMEGVSRGMTAVGSLSLAFFACKQALDTASQARGVIETWANTRFMRSFQQSSEFLTSSGELPQDGTYVSDQTVTTFYEPEGLANFLVAQGFTRELSEWQRRTDLEVVENPTWTPTTPNWSYNYGSSCSYCLDDDSDG